MPDRATPVAVTVEASESERLLGLARAAVRAAVEGGAAASIAPALGRSGPPAGDRCAGLRAAAFVTLTKNGELRGCVGRLEPEAAVEASVVTAATWAALDDPRFPPVLPHELTQLHIEVSILGPLVRLEDPLAFRPGVDGIVVERQGRRGLLLPEVASALDDDPVAMLDAACRKAGLEPGAWRQAGTTVMAFRTMRFGGPVVV